MNINSLIKKKSLKSSNPLVSVLIPAYNHENYVQETINSIINQTYQNIELIICDDGSKDSTWNKIKELEEKCKKRFTNVYFETKENEGTCKTLNKMIGKSNGEYIYIIASDDISKPLAIEKEVNFLENNPKYALCVGNNEFVDSNSCVTYWNKDREITNNKKSAKYKTFADFFQKMKGFKFTSKLFGTYESIYCNNYIPNGYLIRKSIFEKTGLFTTEAPLEDYYLMLQISKYSKMKYLNEILFSYRMHNTNTIKNNKKMEMITLKTLEFELKLLENSNISMFNNDVNETYLKGGFCHKKGIPFIFEIIKRKKYDIKTKQFKAKKYFKIFGINF